MQFPTIKSPEEAIFLAKQNHDRFYLAAFRFQTWISELSVRAIAEYADKPNPADRHMQSGQAWEAFHRVFGRVRYERFHDVVNSLTRFAECENLISDTLRCALAPVYLEHDLSGDYFGPKVPDFSDQPLEFAVLMRRSVRRMCDWLDAVIHLNTHVLWFRQPACFDPDPEKRRLALGEVGPQGTAQTADPEMVRIYVHPSTPFNRLHSSAPLPSDTPHSALYTPQSEGADTTTFISERPWAFRKLDQGVIALWPLLKLHNWTYADLWNVLCHADIQPDPSPCPNSRHLAAYCCHTLGLRKTGHGHTDPDARPPGHDLAQRLLQPKHASPALG